LAKKRKRDDSERGRTDPHGGKRRKVDGIGVCVIKKIRGAVEKSQRTKFKKKTGGELEGFGWKRGAYWRNALAARAMKRGKGAREVGFAGKLRRNRSCADGVGDEAR